MTTVGICRCKDEADVIETVVRHMLGQVDAVLVEDNVSTDGTLEILQKLREEYAGRLKVQEDETVAYYQAVSMTRLAADANYWLGGDIDDASLWVVPFDADEVWVAKEPSWGRIADVLAGLPATESIAPAEVFDHVATGADLPGETNPIVRMTWRKQDPLGLPKVAARPRMSVRIHQGNHGADYGTTSPGFVLRVHHFPLRTPAQMIRKTRNGAAAYRATDLPADVGAHWRQWDTFTDAEIEAIFRRWYYRPDPNRPLTVDGETLLPLVYDPVVQASRI